MSQGSGSTIVLYMSGLHRALNMPEQFLDMSRSVWMAFVLHLSIVMLYLTESWTVFLNSEKLIFYRSWKYLFDFVFCFRLNIFTSKNSHLLLPLGLRYTQLIYPWCFLMIYLYNLLLFFHFLVLQRSSSEIYKVCKTVIGPEITLKTS